MELHGKHQAPKSAVCPGEGWSGILCLSAAAFRHHYHLPNHIVYLKQKQNNGNLDQVTVAKAGNVSGISLSQTGF
jgi:hypothetical protein